MENKYNPCCDSRCLVSHCDVREGGGCACVCRLTGAITKIKASIQGNSLVYADGMMVYIPNDEDRKKRYKNMDLQDREFHDNFTQIEGPRLLKDMEERVKEYEVKTV